MSAVRYVVGKTPRKANLAPRKANARPSVPASRHHSNQALLDGWSLGRAFPRAPIVPVLCPFSDRRATHAARRERGHGEGDQRCEAWGASTNGDMSGGSSTTSMDGSTARARGRRAEETRSGSSEVVSKRSDAGA